MEQFVQGSTIGYIGLGKMGSNMVKRMREFNYNVTATDPNEKARAGAESVGVDTYETASEVVNALSSPRVVWVMVPHQAVDTVLDELDGNLEEGDLIIEGGNSPYTATVERSKRFQDQGVHFVDIGVSGGPSGARNGACMMVGGPKEQYDRLTPLLQILNVDGGYGYMGESGAGHFVKMVHNGIEYGMMQAIAEGFDVMKSSQYNLDLAEVARVYSNGSVIESKLIDDMYEAYLQWGRDLSSVSGSAHASGEADWTIQAADELGVMHSVISDALEARYKSQEEPTYQGKVISALRNKFGGHALDQGEDR